MLSVWCHGIRLTLAVLGTLLAAAAAHAASPQAEACNAKPVITQPIACLRDAAVAAADPAVCEAAADPRAAFHCLALYAENAGDPAPCARIETGANAAETSALRQACVIGVAVKTGNADLCDDPSASEFRDTCILMLVSETGADDALCARIGNQPLRQACEAAAAQ